MQIYSHYKLSIPNQFTQLRISGNYILKVLNEDKEVVFSRKFVVYEEGIQVGLSVRRPRDFETIDAKQNIEFLRSAREALIPNLGGLTGAKAAETETIADLKRQIADLQAKLDKIAAE